MMMQGRGVINFSSDKPSHEYTTSTTEFDDELIKRGIVTTEQSIMAKGASFEEAIRLIEEEKEKKQQQRDKKYQGGYQTRTIGGRQRYEEVNDNNNNDSDDDDDDDYDSFEDDSDDEAFMKRYRQERFEQLKKQQDITATSKKKNKNGELSHYHRPTSVMHITRHEWKEEVNDASMDGRWVIITMTENSGNLKDHVVQELHKIAREYNHNNDNSSRSSSSSSNTNNFSDDDDDNSNRNTNNFRLLTINTEDAIPNWPEERVPAMFAYQDGVKQHEWVASRRGEFPSRAYLEELFRKWTVI